jgi:hypothetical protein
LLLILLQANLTFIKNVIGKFDLMAQLNIKAFLHYYKTITVINLVFSAIMALFTQNIYWFPILFSTFGIGVGILYFNYYFKNQYYFYHNLGYTRKKLALNTLFINLPISVVVLAIIVIA